MVRTNKMNKIVQQLLINTQCYIAFNDPVSILDIPISLTPTKEYELISKLPAAYEPEADTGFMQLAAYNLLGYPNAFCPGIR